MPLHPRKKEEKLEAFQRLCRERRIPATVQRRVIFETVLDSEGHPSADEVYESVQHRLPGVSRATVYRVLEMLVSLGLIGKPSHLGSAMRYDMSTHRHHHLVCSRCEKTIDIDDPMLNKLAVPDTRMSGFKIADYSVHFTGLCRTCQKEDGPVSRAKKPRTKVPALRKRISR